MTGYVQVTAHADAEVDRYQSGGVAGETDEFLATTRADGIGVYVRRAAGGTILVDIDHEADSPALIVSIDDVTHYNDEMPGSP